MSTEIAINNIEQLKANWGKLAVLKQETTAELSKMQLAAQAILLRSEHTIPGIEAQLAEYRKATEAIVSFRRGHKFQLYLNKIQDEIMSYEKQLDSEEYKNKKAELLRMKLDAEKSANLLASKQIEANQFTAHCKNEVIRRVAGWRAEVMEFVQKHYEEALKEKEDVSKRIELLKIAIVEIPLPPSMKFQSALLSMEEKKAIHLQHTMPVKEVLVRDMEAWIDDKFAMYDHDLAAGVVQPLEIVDNSAVEIAMNNFEASVTPEILPEGKQLKRKMVVAQEETQEFAMKICFLMSRSPSVWEYLNKRQKYSTLSINTLCDCISKYTTETGEQLPNLKYEEVVI